MLTALVSRSVTAAMKLKIMKLVPLAAALAAAFAISACSTIRSYHGYVPERSDAPDTAVIGEDTKATVLTKFGEPSTLGTFDGDIWYYISARTQQRAFLSQKTVWRQVVAVRFDESGTVSEVRVADVDDAISVAHVNRVTPTRGKTLSLLQQLFGNIGRLPAPNQGPGAPGGPNVQR